MSDIFISYSHQDEIHRDNLIEKLEKAEMDFWYDQYIEGGRQWREEIDVALEESFVVVVIVTSESIKSRPVTYEWSWAIGNGKPVIPLLFESVEFKDVHPQLSALQHVFCHEQISDSLIDLLKSHQFDTPVTLALKKMIINTIMPFRLLSHFSLFLCPLVEQEIIEKEVLFKFLHKAIKEAYTLKDVTLGELMVNKSHAFTRKLIRVCNDYINKLNRYIDFLDVIGMAPLIDEDNKWKIDITNFDRAEKYRIEELESNISGIDPYSKVPGGYYSIFRFYLEDLSDHKSITDEEMTDIWRRYDILPDVLLNRFLDEESSELIWTTLENIRKQFIR